MLSQLEHIRILVGINSKICEFICPNNRDSETKVSGKEFIKKLNAAGMFIVPLDTSGVWYRYHHLFQDLVYERLQEIVNFDGIRKLHGKAAEWFETNGFTELAIQHFILAGMEEKALKYFSFFRTILLADRRWSEHESLLNQFPQGLGKNSTVLLLSRAWIFVYHGKMQEAFELLDHIGSGLDGQNSNKSEKNKLSGELNSLRAYQTYYLGDAEPCMKYAQSAIDLLDEDNAYPLGLAWIFLGGALQMADQAETAFHELRQVLEESEDPGLTSSIFLIINYLHWFEGNLAELQTYSSLYKELGEKYKIPELVANAMAFMGHGQYQRNQLTIAEECYEKAYDQRYHAIGSIRTNFMIAFAMTSFELGKHDRAYKLLDELDFYAASSGNEYNIKSIRLARAEIEFRAGNLEKAFQFTQKIGTLPQRPLSNFFAPQLSMAKIWLYYRLPHCNEEGLRLLEETEEYLRSVNNRRFLIDLKALKSLHYHAAGDQEASFSFLKEAMNYARPGGFIRVFTDMGDKMKDLLILFRENSPHDDYIDFLLESFGTNVKEKKPLLLSERENQVLVALSEKLTNKEIGAKLYITEKTVKRHLNNIYRKLEVSGRREARLKASEQGIL